MDPSENNSPRLTSFYYSIRVGGETLKLDLEF